MPLPAVTIFQYCERGAGAAFWAEPLNAVTNGAFLLAALAGAAMIAKRPPHQRSPWHIFFVLNFIAIGIGSFLFHTMPGAGTELADIGPIGLFMLTYLVYALRRFAGATPIFTVAAVAVFIGAMVMAFNMKCWNGEMGLDLEVPAGARAQCMNGSLGYGPALAAMVLIGGWLVLLRHRAAPLIVAASTVFIVSLTFRSLDQRLCADWIVLGHRMGTHFLWHLCNALTLFLLVAAAIKYGGGQEVMPPRPKARRPLYAAT
jgi:hypothetical protein